MDEKELLYLADVEIPYQRSLIREAERQIKLANYKAGKLWPEKPEPPKWKGIMAKIKNRLRLDHDTI